MAEPSSGKGLQSLVFDNRFTRLLPADTETRNFRRNVKQAAYSRVAPTPVSQPKLIAYSRDVAEMLDLSATDVEGSLEFAEVFGGNRLLPGMDPYAMCYGGHQFGQWAGQLGDGRAINLGEVLNRRGEHWTLQLKGAGPTPYSRTADGLAVLRSSVREFLCSEAMHHLGVPTTRALSLVATGEQVMRDMFYDGRAKYEPGAVVCRVAPSFTRFGNFQIFTSRGETENLKQLVDVTIGTDFPEFGEPCVATYSAWFAEVCRRTALMVVHWMRVGFVHGVMNTDNMSILGLTIDYGPYGWLENYDPDWTPNTTDASGRRYSFGQQPQIAMWNLVQLAHALVTLFPDTAPLQSGLEIYSQTFNEQWPRMVAQKLGLASFQPAEDTQLIDSLFEILPTIETDMTIFFRRLAFFGTDIDRHDDRALLAPIAPAFYRAEQATGDATAPLVAWLRQYQERIVQDRTPVAERRRMMDAVNPKYVLRNYMAQLAIDQCEAGDASLIEQLLELLRGL